MQEMRLVRLVHRTKTIPCPHPAPCALDVGGGQHLGQQGGGHEGGVAHHHKGALVLVGHLQCEYWQAACQARLVGWRPMG